jgi:2-hydroxy-6-oxonona-2,4-dienedioate hydrolase
MDQKTIEPRRAWVEVKGLRMHARVLDGKAPPEAPAIVLVHGLTVSSRYMMPVAQWLAPHYRGYAPDLPGFGRSANPDHTLNVTELADALAGWINAVGLTKPVLLGNSFGCQVIVEFALRHPQMLERAVLQGPSIDAKRRTPLQQVVRWLVSSLREPPSMSLIIVRDFIDGGLRRTLRTLWYALTDPIEKKLPDMQAPTLVVRGSKDEIAPQDWVEQVANLLPRGRLEVIQGATHTLNYAAPQELARVVRAFVEDQELRAWPTKTVA